MYHANQRKNISGIPVGFVVIPLAIGHIPIFTLQCPDCLIRSACFCLYAAMLMVERLEMQHSLQGLQCCLYCDQMDKLSQRPVLLSYTHGSNRKPMSF